MKTAKQQVCTYAYTAERDNSYSSADLHIIFTVSAAEVNKTKKKSRNIVANFCLICFSPTREPGYIPLLLQLSLVSFVLQSFMLAQLKLVKVFLPATQSPQH